MNKNLTDITVVLDRSGSMQTCRTDAEGGLNAFIDDQKTKPGAANFSLVMFDNEYEWVHRAKPIGEVGKCELIPRGNTAMLDAIGKAIVETGERLAKMPEHDRPGLVVFVILTDGQENASTEYKRDQIKAMIERQTKDYNWQFMYLGANQDAFAEASSMAIKTSNIANYSTNNSTAAFASAGASTSRMRYACMVGGNVNAAAAYTEDERKSMVAP